MHRTGPLAASFGLASALSVVVLGDESGYLSTEHQKVKLASIEGMWKTGPAPAAFTAFGFPDQEARETHYWHMAPANWPSVRIAGSTRESPGCPTFNRRWCVKRRSAEKSTPGAVLMPIDMAR